MSQEMNLNDILTPEEKNKVANLKEQMREAPNKKEVDGIADEIYAIYEKARERYSQKDEKTQDEMSASISFA